MKRVALGLVLAGGAAACLRRAPVPDTLVILHGRDVEGLDPHTAGEVWHTQTVLANLYETLVTVDARMSLLPALAASWTNPDEYTWEFQLRPNIPFQTGDVLQAEDVVFSLLRARDHPRSVLRASLADLDEVRALPGNRVRLRTGHPDAFLAARLRDVFVVSRRFVAARGDQGFDRESCGTGPYRLTAWHRGASVDLARFDRYWRGAAAIPRARFVAREYGDADADRFIPPSGRLLFHNPPGAAFHERALKEGVSHFAPTLSVTYLAFDLRGDKTPAVALPDGTNRNPFRDARVREALARAIRTKELIEARRNEGYIPTQLVPSMVFGFDPSIRRPAGGVEGALRLLRETPYAAGFEVILDVRRTMSAYAGSLGEDLAEIGVRTRSRIAEDREFFDRLRGAHSSLYVLRFSCRTGDAQEFLDKWVHSRDARRGFGVFNFSYEVDPIPGLDDEIDAARRELNTTIRRERLQRIMRRVMEASLAVPLFTEKDYTFASKDVEWENRADNFRLVYEARFR